MDFDRLYEALRLYAQGANPYQQDVNWVPYPPGLFVLAPLGLLSRQAAERVWTVLDVGALGLLLWSGAGLFPGLRTPAQWRWFLAGALSLAPIHTALTNGNSSLEFGAVAIALFRLLQRGDRPAAGLLLGILLMKPNFGLPAAVVTLILARWRTLLLAAVVAGLTSLPMFWRLGVRTSLAGFLHFAGAVSSQGMLDTTDNPYHHVVLDLRGWLFPLFGPGWTEALTVLGLGAILVALIRYRALALPAQAGMPLSPAPAFFWTLVACFTCLTFYHRFYDAVLLVVALAAGLYLNRIGRRAGWSWWLVLGVFAVPGAAWLHRSLADLVHRYLVLESLLVRHDTIAIMVLAGLSMAGLRRCHRRDRDQL